MHNYSQFFAKFLFSKDYYFAKERRMHKQKTSSSTRKEECLIKKLRSQQKKKISSLLTSSSTNSQNFNLNKISNVATICLINEMINENEAIHCNTAH